MPRIELADRSIDDPVARLVAYGLKYAKTVSEFDLGERGDPGILSEAEVVSTRVISSRISNKELAWFVQRAETAPWDAVAHDALLRDAEPGQSDGLYERATALYDHFRAAAPRGVAVAKVSKVLHRKRPGLVPILDSHLLGTYRSRARAAGQRLAPTSGRARHLYWVAIRDDLTMPANVASLAEIRGTLLEHADPKVSRLANLTDLRIIDILAW